jgi:aspartyl-tRNA(Asn)/glutamyl-tRNA(Gln) amidotransferase subunit A
MPTTSRRGFLAAGLGAAAAPRFAGAAVSSELCALTLKQASDSIRSKKVSPVELTQACLDRIKTYNPKINAWITVMGEKALAQAKTLAEEQAAGKLRSPLHGIPLGVKDSIDVLGARATAASAVYEYRFPSEDAEVVRRLRAAGAVIIGKCNMHEFDAGASAAVSYWGPVRNPWNLERVSGGPSGGSAAAVAMENCFGALGTDTGGGIRTPAAYCGVVGVKPTYGRVSLRGIVPFAWSLDHCGPIARTVEDAAMVLQQIAGYDHLDIDSLDKPVPNYSSAIGAPVAQFRLGVPVQFYDHLDEDVARAIDDAMAVLNKLTKGSHEVSLPSLLHASVGAEIATFHENLRGVNGGGFEASTGRAFPSADAARAVDYIRGWRDLTMVRRMIDEDVFQKQGVDLLIAPASRHTAPTIEEELTQGTGATAGGGGGRGGAGGGGRGGAGAGAAGAAAGATGGAPAGATGGAPVAQASGANARSRTQIDPEENTRAFNAYGLPTITIPCGFTKDGMPIGLQIAGAQWAEANVFALAHAYQEATEWHKKRPPLTPDAKVPTLSKAAAEQTGG